MPVPASSRASGCEGMSARRYAHAPWHIRQWKPCMAGAPIIAERIVGWGTEREQIDLLSIANSLRRANIADGDQGAFKLVEKCWGIILA